MLSLVALLLLRQSPSVSVQAGMYTLPELGEILKAQGVALAPLPESGVVWAVHVKNRLADAVVKALVRSGGLTVRRDRSTWVIERDLKFEERNSVLGGEYLRKRRVSLANDVSAAASAIVDELTIEPYHAIRGGVSKRLEGSKRAAAIAQKAIDEGIAPVSLSWMAEKLQGTGYLGRIDVSPVAGEMSKRAFRADQQFVHGIHTMLKMHGVDLRDDLEVRRNLGLLDIYRQAEMDPTGPDSWFTYRIVPRTGEDFQWPGRISLGPGLPDPSIDWRASLTAEERRTYDETRSTSRKLLDDASFGVAAKRGCRRLSFGLLAWSIASRGDLVARVSPGFDTVAAPRSEERVGAWVKQVTGLAADSTRTPTAPGPAHGLAMSRVEGIWVLSDGLPLVDGLLALPASAAVDLDRVAWRGDAPTLDTLLACAGRTSWPSIPAGQLPSGFGESPDFAGMVPFLMLLRESPDLLAKVRELEEGSSLAVPLGSLPANARTRFVALLKKAAGIHGPGESPVSDRLMARTPWFANWLRSAEVRFVRVSKEGPPIFSLSVGWRALWSAPLAEGEGK